MIKEIIEALQHDKWLNAGNFIEIAKGKNQLPKTAKQTINKIKRQWQSRK